MSASMVNIDYGTRRGWGEPLSEDTPFVSVAQLPLFKPQD